MLVKCKICGQKIDRNQAYKLVINGKCNYYCNEEEYIEWVRHQEVKDNVYNTINWIFNRKVINTALFKEMNEIVKIYTYETILGYLNENKNYLNDVIMGKSFSSEYAQIRYFSAILRNSLQDYQNTHIQQPEIKKIEVDIPDSKYVRKNRRVPLVEYEQKAGDDV